MDNQPKFSNKRISTPVGIFIIVLVTLLAGGILAWQYLEAPEGKAPSVPADEKPSTITKTGRVYVFGNEPFTKLGLEIEGEKTYCLIGPLEDELWNLQNTTLTIEGNIVEEYFCRSEGKTINVISYSPIKEEPKAEIKTYCEDLLDEINKKITELNKSCSADKDCIVAELLSENKLGGTDLTCINKGESAEEIRNLQELRHQKCEEFMPELLISIKPFYGCECKNNFCSDSAD